MAAFGTRSTSHLSRPRTATARAASAAPAPPRRLRRVSRPGRSGSSPARSSSASGCRRTTGWPKCFCSACGGALWSRSPAEAALVSVRLGTFDTDPGIRPQWPAVRRVRRPVGADPRRRPASVRGAAARLMPRARATQPEEGRQVDGLAARAGRRARARARAAQRDRKLRAEPDLPRRRRRGACGRTRRTRRSSGRSATSRTRQAACSSGSGTCPTANGPPRATASSSAIRSQSRCASTRGAGCSATGRRVEVAWSCTPLPRIASGPVFLVSGTDITDRKRHEAEVRQSRARIVAAADNARRRLERNLHDGAQQRLIALLVQLRGAQRGLIDPADALSRLSTSSRPP